MNIVYTIKWFKNGKKYGYRGNNWKLVKRAIRKFKIKTWSWFDWDNL